MLKCPIYCLQQNKNETIYNSQRKRFIYLLHLELDGGFDLIHLGIHVLIVGEQRGELASLVQTRTQDTRDLLDQRLRSEEGIVLLGYKGMGKEENKSVFAKTQTVTGPTICEFHTKLLDQLFVLIQLLESLNVHMWQFSSFGLIAVLLVSQDADRELWPGERLQPGYSELNTY